LFFPGICTFHYDNYEFFRHRTRMYNTSDTKSRYLTHSRCSIVKLTCSESVSPRSTVAPHILSN
jgi:hypothetical protein